MKALAWLTIFCGVLITVMTLVACLAVARLTPSTISIVDTIFVTIEFFCGIGLFICGVIGLK